MNDQERSIKNFVESAFMHGILFAVQFQRRNPNAFNLQEKELEDMARRAAGHGGTGIIGPRSGALIALWTRRS